MREAALWEFVGAGEEGVGEEVEGVVVALNDPVPVLLNAKETKSQIIFFF